MEGPNGEKHDSTVTVRSWPPCAVGGISRTV
jgi:hypothetical protein